MVQPRIKAIIAKLGLDGHEMGARLISRVLMDAGLEVIYTGPRQTPATVVTTAIQEDVNIIGLSFLSGAHKEHTAKTISLLKNSGISLDKLVLVVGGIIPPSDVKYLKSLGVDAVFGPGSDTREIVKTILECYRKKNAHFERLKK